MSLAHALDLTGAWIIQLTPNTPPAAWLPYARFSWIAVLTLIVAASTRVLSGSRTAAVAAGAGFAASAIFAGGAVGPLVVVLAVFGLFTNPFSRSPYWLIPGLLLLSVLTGAIQEGPITWSLCGCGLAGVAASLNGSRRSRVTGPALVAVLTLVIVTARLPAAETSTPAARAPLGHDRATLKSMSALLSNIPSGSAIVDEDPVTDRLFRALAPKLARARLSLGVVSNDAAAVRETLKTTRVFALPYAQQSLSMQGFEMADSLRTADRGLTEVIAAAACVRASDTWQRAPAIEGRTRIALVAAQADERGPASMYLYARSAPIRVAAVNWPARTMRGFSPRTFDPASPADQKELNAQIADDGLEGAPDAAAFPFVTRIALWRMPDAASALAIDLSEPPEHAIVRLSPEAKHPISVCPVFPATVSPIR
jgi:hypothetical protein